MGCPKGVARRWEGCGGVEGSCSRNRACPTETGMEEVSSGKDKKEKKTETGRTQETGRRVKTSGLAVPEQNKVGERADGSDVTMQGVPVYLRAAWLTDCCRDEGGSQSPRGSVRIMSATEPVLCAQMIVLSRCREEEQQGARMWAALVGSM